MPLRSQNRCIIFPTKLSRMVWFSSWNLVSRYCFCLCFVASSLNLGELGSIHREDVMTPIVYEYSDLKVSASCWWLRLGRLCLFSNFLMNKVWKLIISITKLSMCIKRNVMWCFEPGEWMMTYFSAKDNWKRTRKGKSHFFQQGRTSLTEKIRLSELFQMFKNFWHLRKFSATLSRTRLRFVWNSPCAPLISFRAVVELCVATEFGRGMNRRS